MPWAPMSASSRYVSEDLVANSFANAPQMPDTPTPNRSESGLRARLVLGGGSHGGHVVYRRKLAISVDLFATLDDFIKRSNRVWVAGSAVHQKCRQCQSKENVEDCNFHLSFTKGRQNSLEESAYCLPSKTRGQKKTNQKLNQKLLGTLLNV